MVVSVVWCGLRDLFRPAWFRSPPGTYPEYRNVYMPGVTEAEDYLYSRFDEWWWVATEGGVGSGTFLIGLIYLCLIPLGQRLMKHRRPYEVKKSLFWWNVALATFSTLGTLRTAPELIDIFVQHDLKDAVYTSTCEGRFNTGAIGVWPILFGLSKIVELGDTVFLVIRKKPVIFLHYIHHLITMCVCGYYAIDQQANSRWCVVTNLFVHSVMYSYFALKAVDVKVSKAVSMSITLLQISQMVIGTFVCVVSLYQYFMGNHCANSAGMVVACLAMYLLYFALFGQFFRKAYMGRGGRRTTARITDGNNNVGSDGRTVDTAGKERGTTVEIGEAMVANGDLRKRVNLE